jgi:hypothetical protein
MGTGDKCPKCRGSGWVQPWGYVWDRHIGWVLKENAPPHQCADCCGTGARAANSSPLRDTPSDTTAHTAPLGTEK